MALSKRRKLSLLLAGLVVIALAGAAAVFVAPHLAPEVKLTAAELSAAPVPGAPAPAFTAVDTRGASHSLAAYRGKWVVLEWFNHECPYTKKHYADLDGGPGNTQAMQRDYADRVVWLSVVSSAPGKQGFTTAEKADELTREKGAAPTAVIRDTTGALGRLYGARNTPQYMIIDPQGVLRYAGAIDDRQSSSVKDIATATNYVRAALDAVLVSQKPVEMGQCQLWPLAERATCNADRHARRGLPAEREPGHDDVLFQRILRLNLFLSRLIFLHRCWLRLRLWPRPVRIPPRWCRRSRPACRRAHGAGRGGARQLRRRRNRHRRARVGRG